MLQIRCIVLCFSLCGTLCVWHVCRGQSEITVFFSALSEGCYHVRLFPQRVPGTKLRKLAGSMFDDIKEVTKDGAWCSDITCGQWLQLVAAVVN